MLTAVWIALAAGGACVIGALALAVVRALRAWRTFRALSRSITRRLGELEAQAAATEERAAAATAQTARLLDAVAGLQRSLAALAVLRAAAAEARAGAGRVRGVVPRK